MEMELSTLRRTRTPVTIALSPFDIHMHCTEASLRQIQSRFATFLRTLDGPSRFTVFYTPTSLQTLVKWTIEEAGQASQAARQVDTSHARRLIRRKEALSHYRQWYEELQRNANYQRADCLLTTWAYNAAGQTLGAARAYLDSQAAERELPPLLQGTYHVCPTPIWHLAPIGHPTGRPLVCLIGTYAFKPAEWTFFNPLLSLWTLEYPVAVCIDIPKTWETQEAVAKLEGVMTALKTHLEGKRSPDTASANQFQHCQYTIDELHGGQALHDVQIKLALFAPDGATLRERVNQLRNNLKPYLGLKVEIGGDQITAAKYFSQIETSRLEGRPNTWPITSPGVALTMGFLGIRKLEPKRGIVRGINISGGKYPYIYDDWDLSRGKKALHELWVGTTGSGKTFALNCYLARDLAHHGIAFDLLEPMGHGLLLAKSYDIKPFVLSAKHTFLNPHDPVYDNVGEQIAHVIGIYETFLRRELKGDQISNLQGALLSTALAPYYHGRDLTRMLPDEAPTVDDVCNRLAGLGQNERIRAIAQDFADEIAGLATSDGPYAYFINGLTNIDLSIATENDPRIFCFHELEQDPVLIAIAYAQVLATLMRTAMTDDTPRIIAVDEVYRMMRHPALLDFLITAVKTLRTKRKKLILIDQQMRIFLQSQDPRTRLLFENCPIRVIFSQRGGEDIFATDPAFSHLTARHKEIISDLAPFHFLVETPEDGIFHLYNQPSHHELQRFGSS